MAEFDTCMICGSTNFEAMKSSNWVITGIGDVPVQFGACRDCGHIFQNPLPALETIEAFYTEFSNYLKPDPNWVPPETPETPTSARLIDLANHFRPEKGSVYEIGCGSGMHLYYFQKDGWNVQGCEPSPDAGAQAQALLNSKIDIGFASDCLTGSPKYDVVTLSHVLEHVPDPRALLELARDQVADDGVFILEVPCARQPSRLCIGWLALEHLSYFSEPVLTRLMEETGFEVLQIIIDDLNPKYPTITVAARPCKNAGGGNTPYLNAFPVNRDMLAKHIQIDTQHWDRVNERFAHVNDAYIWAAGVHTAQLFSETSILATVNIKALVDSSPLKTGKKQGPYNILSKEQFFKAYKGEHVIISSYASEKAIADALKSDGISEDKIVRLYT